MPGALRGDPTGFTLIELLAAMAIAALIMGIMASVFISALQAWERASTDIALITTGEDTMCKLVTGVGLRGSELGLEDSLAVLHADPHRIVVLPAWRKVYVVEPDHTVSLDPGFQAGAAPPLGFLLPGRTPLQIAVNDAGTKVAFSRKIAVGARVELYYRPVATAKSAHLTYTLDPAGYHVRRMYGNDIRLLPAGNRGVKIKDMTFQYYLAGAEDAPVAKVDRHLDWIRGVGVRITLVKNGRMHEVRRIVNLRNATSSILVTGPVQNLAILPPPGRVRVFEMRYLAGAEIGDKIAMRAGPWSCKLKMIAKDTALVTQSVDGLGTHQTTIHTAFGLGFLNPDVLLDVDGSDTPGQGDIMRCLEVKPGLPVIPLGSGSGVHYLDMNRSGTYDIGESIFIDSNLDGRLDSADRLLLRNIADDRSAPVRLLSGKTDSVAYYESVGAKRFDDGEDLVFDGDGDGVFGGPFYDCCGAAGRVKLSVTEFTIKGASIIIR